MITKLVGKADDYELVFQERDGIWVCPVPPPLKTGRYAVELLAKDNAGNQLYWAGNLYICDSRYAYLELDGECLEASHGFEYSFSAQPMRDNYQVITGKKPGREAVLLKENYIVKVW